MKVLLGICGGIAAYKAAYLASLMVKSSFEVTAVMTEAARRFITPLTFRTLTGNKVYTELFDENFSDNHIALSEWADTLVVVPATATTIARIAGGFADDLLSAVALDYTGPVFICPAMHENMWKNPATDRNIKDLISRGYYIIGPETGDLAGGKKGEGRLVEPRDLFSRIIDTIKKEHPALLS